MSTVRSNAAAIPRQFSTYVVAAMLAGADYWMRMTPAEQLALFTLMPWLKAWAVPIGALAYVAAKLWPQNITQSVPVATVETSEAPDYIQREDDQRGGP